MTMCIRLIMHLGFGIGAQSLMSDSTLAKLKASHVQVLCLGFITFESALLSRTFIIKLFIRPLNTHYSYFTTKFKIC